MTGSRSFKPAALQLARGATTSATPCAMEKYPRPLANLSCDDCERPGRAVLRTTSCMESSIHPGLQHHLDAAVLLVTERLVHLRPAFERLGMGDHERRVDLIFQYPIEQVVSPPVHMGLTGADGQSLVHDGSQRDFVQQAAIDAGNRENAGRTADIHHLAKHVRTIGFQHHGLLGAVVHRIHRTSRMSLQAYGIDAFFRTLAASKLVQSLHDTFFFKVDRNRAACLGHREALRETINRDDLFGPEQHSASDSHLPDRAAAPDRDSVGRLDVALNRSLPAGREYIGQEQQLFVGNTVRNPDVRGLGKRDAKIFRLAAGIAAGQMCIAEQARSRVSESLVCKILVAVRRFANGKVPTPALFAFAADNGEWYHHPIAHLERFPCRRTNLYHLAHGFMAHHVPGFHSGHEVVVEVEVRAANRATGYLDDGVPLLLDPGIGYALTADVRGAMPNECLHRDLRCLKKPSFSLNISRTRSFLASVCKAATSRGLTSLRRLCRSAVWIGHVGQIRRLPFP